MSSPQENRFPISIAVLALVAYIVLIWANSVGGGPVFDDHFLVVQQDCFRTVRGMIDIATLQHCTYRPLRYLSYGVDDLIFGGQFWGFHIGNIGLHLLATLIAGLLALELGRRAAPSGARKAGPNSGSGPPERGVLWFAIAVAAFWAVHPVQTDSVSYVSGRRDILAGLFTMASVWLALVADRKGGLWWLLPLWTTLFAFLSKESAVVIPALFLVWKLREISLKDWVKSNLGAFISGVVGLTLSFMMVLYRGVFASHSNRGFEWWGGTMVSNFATVAALQVKYLQHVFLSAPLIGDYKPHSIALAESFADPRSVVGVLLIIGLCAIMRFTRNKRPLVAYGIAWYLLSLTPVSHIFPHHELYAEHYLYIPLFGAAVAIVDTARWAIQRLDVRSSIYGGAFVLALGIMGVMVVDRNRDFSDEQTFYENVISHSPRNLRAMSNLANIYFDDEEWEKSLVYFEQLSPLWEAGTGDQLNHEMRLVQAAMAVGRQELARTTIERVATDHAELGIGHRWRTEVCMQEDDPACVFDASLDWWAVTRNERGIPIAVEAFHLGSLGAEAAQRLADTARASSDRLDTSSMQGIAAALGQIGNEAGAFELLVSWREPTDPSLDPMICEIANRLPSASPPDYCPDNAPTPPPSQ
ncbi:MAG: hypothetical protein ACJAYU_000795 [Bradymonadia bacterium]